jgi:hypothetical protein
MKRTLFIFGCAAMLFATGCVSDNGKFPAPSANFTPKRTYAVPYDKLWQAALDALDKNRITTVSVDKASGIISTDYVAGPGQFMVIMAQSTRYKYSISLRNESDGSVRMNVICKVESSINGQHGADPYRDVTPQNAVLTGKLESWLYEQIETEIKTP